MPFSPSPSAELAPEAQAARAAGLARRTSKLTSTPRWSRVCGQRAAEAGTRRMLGGGNLSGPVKTMRTPSRSRIAGHSLLALIGILASVAFSGAAIFFLALDRQILAISLFNVSTLTAMLVMVATKRRAS